MEKPTSGPVALLSLLLNILVLPGLGTVTGGGSEYRKTGFKQMLLMVLVVPLVLGGGMAAAVVFCGMDVENVKAGAARFLYGLVGLNALFSLKLFFDQWKKRQ